MRLAEAKQVERYAFREQGGHPIEIEELARKVIEES